MFKKIGNDKARDEEKGVTVIQGYLEFFYHERDRSIRFSGDIHHGNGPDGETIVLGFVILFSPGLYWTNASGERIGQVTSEERVTVKANLEEAFKVMETTIFWD